MQVLPSILLGLFFSFCYLIHYLLPIIIVAIVLYLICLFKYPEIVLFIAFMGALDFFSMIKEDFLRIPYLFRLKDILFLVTFLPFIFAFIKGDKRTKDILKNPITKAILVLFTLAISQIIITKINYPGESLGSLIRIGRRYFYFLIFIPSLFILSDVYLFKRFLKIFLFSVIVFCFLYIIQFIIGVKYRMFIGADVSLQELQGFYITRLYVSGSSWVTMVLCVCFFILMFNKESMNRTKSFLLIFITSIQTFITFGRAHIFGIVSGILFAFFCAKEKHKWYKIILLTIISFIFISMITVMHGIIFPEKENLLAPVLKRIASTYDAIIHKEDTFGFRIKDSLGRIELVKNNPFFGVGFVHDESDLFAYARGFNKNIRTTDSGLLTLFIDFGMIGFIWLLWFSYIVYKRAIMIHKNSSNQINKFISIGLLAFYFSRLFSFITLADFVTYDGIVSIVLGLVFLELIKYYDEHNESINNNS